MQIVVSLLLALFKAVVFRAKAWVSSPTVSIGPSYESSGSKISSFRNGSGSLWVAQAVNDATNIERQRNRATFRIMQLRQKIIEFLL